MLKRVSGHMARSNMRLFLWCVMVAATVAGAACVWLAGLQSDLAAGVWIWCGVGGALSAIITIVFSTAESGRTRGCLENFRRPPVMFEVLRCAAPTNWLILVLWLALLPGEVAASFVVWPIVLLVKAMMNPMPGEWD